MYYQCIINVLSMYYQCIHDINYILQLIFLRQKGKIHWKYIENTLKMQFSTEFSMYFQCISLNALKMHTKNQCIFKYHKKQCIINVFSMYYQCIDKKTIKIWFFFNVLSMYFQCIFWLIKKPPAGFFSKQCIINVFLNLKSSKYKNTLKIHWKKMTFFQNTLKIHWKKIRISLKYIENTLIIHWI